MEAVCAQQSEEDTTALEVVRGNERQRTMNSSCRNYGTGVLVVPWHPLASPMRHAPCQSRTRFACRTAAVQADQGYCTDIRDEYVRHFLYGEFVTGGRARGCQRPWGSGLFVWTDPCPSGRGVEKYATRTGGRHVLSAPAPVRLPPCLMRGIMCHQVTAAVVRYVFPVLSTFKTKTIEL